MAGSVASGKLAAQRNKQRYGADYYKRIGAIGGKNGHTGGFAAGKVGKDGLTGSERASKVGAIGGKISRRTKRV